MSQIQINPELIEVPEIEAVIQPVVRVRIYTASDIRTEEPQQWTVPLYAKTTMGFLGVYRGCSSWGYITEVSDYFGRRIYDFIRLTQDV